MFIGLGQTLEILVAAWFIHRCFDTPFRLQSRSEILGLTMAALLSPAVGAAVGATVFAFNRMHPFPEVWPFWWMGDTVGMLIVTPLILAVAQGWGTWRQMGAARWAEAAALLAFLIILGQLVFSGHFPLTFIAVLPLLWASLRFGVPGAVVTAIVLSAIAVRYTAAWYGWFTNPTVDANLRALLLQMCLGIAGVLTVMFVALVNQRQAAHLALQQALQRERETLEARVKERTRALQQSELRFATLLDAEPCAVICIAPDHRILAWNRAAERIYGWSREEALGRNYVTTFLPADMAEAVVEDGRKVLAGKPTAAFENDVVHKDGTRRTLLWSVCRFTDELEKPVGLLAIGLDVTARKRSEAELHTTNENLRRLSARQDALLEAERARIAREIHDDLGAALTGVTMHVRMALNAGDGITPQAQERLTQALQLVDGANQSMHRIINDLHPSVLDHLGIWGGIEWLANQWQARTGLPCEMQLDPKLAECRLADDRALAVFRIVQESLNNVARHADATRADIHARLDDDCVQVTIRDDGRGIDPDRPHEVESMGMLGMRERARHFDGTLEVANDAGGRGTVVALRLPMHD